MSGSSIKQHCLVLSGIVQGVGFRPFVFRLAHELGLSGSVQNCSGQVEICIEGEAARLLDFQQRVIHEAPQLARPVLHGITAGEAQGLNGFVILPSVESTADIHLPLDTAPCPVCLAEMRDPANRRYRYPFTNCTQCGPRFTLIESLPYDRMRTSMAGFPLCPACSAEYEDPLDRRFHAEPIACPVCGPQLAWHSGNAAAQKEPALHAALAALRAGKIIAVRGVGGYHLMCDAGNETAVATLRTRKQRPARPFAVLFAENSPQLHTALAITPAEMTLLQSPQRPIVLVAQRPECRLAPNIAPGLAHIGAMLPYSPLHALLAEDFGNPLVATSGNLSGEPIAIDPAEAEARLGRIADGFLHHDRPIVRPLEDSVWQVYASLGPVPLRLGRGSAPLEFTLPHSLPEPVLALGGEQKVTIALGWGNRAVISPHLGDLEHPESLALLQRVADDFCRLYQVQPRQIAIDAHPGFQSRQWASAQGLPISEIWHHHAHAGALVAEHPDIDDWLMLTWDGVGLGRDGQLWGGEALRGQPGHWQRMAQLRPFRLPGGEAASRELWRSAAGLLWESDMATPSWHPQQPLLHAAWRKGLNSPLTTAAGRLFDGAAALLGLCQTASFEGEGPMRLQALAESAEDGPYWPVNWQEQDGLWTLDWQPWLALLQDAATPAPQRAWALHDALARAVVALPGLLDLPRTTPVGLTGGVFQNRLLVARITQYAGHYAIHLPRCAPPNDAGLALGQLVEAGARHAA